MRILLDTHAFIWAVTEPEMLTVQARNALGAQTSSYLSVAAIWEIAIKRARFGATSLPFSADDAITLAHDANVEILPISARHAASTEQLPIHHRDPFDRIMIAQAKFEDMTFMSRDPVMASYAIKVIVA
jgi:PIN domain nuclease of toxin-antitoxin system